jgi:hypothetical protein
MTCTSSAHRWFAVILVGAAATILAVRLRAAVIPDQELFASGRAALERGNVIEALMYLFAYEQRSPIVLQQDPEHSNQVGEAIRFSKSQLQSTIDRRNALEQEVRQLRESLGMPAGVSGAPRLIIPRLDSPRFAEGPSYPLACRGGGGLEFSLVGQGFGMSGTMFVIEFQRAAAAGIASLAPGECSWMDRPVGPTEPNRICQTVEPARLHLHWTADNTVQNLSSRSAPFLSVLVSPAQVFTFQAHNNGAGCLVARVNRGRLGRGRGV